MNILELVKSFFERGLKKRPTLPGWRHPGYQSKKSRTPFSSSRVRDVGPQRMTIERFADKAERDERFRDLRSRGTPNVSKFSTVEEVSAVGERQFKSIWCVVKP